MSDRHGSARVLLFDADGGLVLIRRTRPGVAAYLTTPGGRIEPGETATGAAIRECAEELGATIRLGRQVHVIDDPAGSQAFYLARVLHADPHACTGPELSEPGRGEYLPVHVDWTDPDQISILRPATLRGVLLTHGHAWADEATALLPAD